ncbi:ankyrin, partial [Hesseltinella vesiculosa]
SIWHAAEEGNYDALKAHLDGCSSPRELKAMVNGRDPSTDASLLHLYATSAPETRLAMVRLLLESGADASSTNVYNVQPIHMVSLHFPLHAVSFLKALLEFGANIHARDGDGWTPLHYAARFCQPPKEAMQLLVEHGADVNAVDDSNHKSCLYGLIANGDHLACFQWMVEHGQAN